jgi:hypothetical protein
MYKRVIGFAVLAILVGVAVVFTQAWIIGLFAAQASPVTPRNITLGELELRGLWYGVLWFWGLPSALGALLIAFFTPKRWILYSSCAALPVALAMFAGLSNPTAYGVITGLINLALMPLFLGLYYSLVRRHSGS